MGRKGQTEISANVEKTVKGHRGGLRLWLTRFIGDGGQERLSEEPQALRCKHSTLHC